MILKWLKRIGLVILGVIVLGLGYIVLTGDHYWFFMLKHTVFEGRMGPTIDEYVNYENGVVEAPNDVFEWPIAGSYGEVSLSEEDEAYHESLESYAFLVIHKDSIVYEKYWNGYSDSSKTNSWSMAKSIVSHLIGCAIQDGYIKSIDDSIGTYVDQFKGDGVTIRDLLTMSAGYNFYESYGDPFTYTARTLYGDNLREVHEMYELTDETGTTFNYKSGNTQILGFILKEATGKSLSEYATEKVWKPIGAKHDALWSLDRKGGEERAYCCFNTNARDYAKFGKLYKDSCIIDGDTLVPLWYYNEAISLAPLKLKSGEPNDRYGFQWWIHQDSAVPCFYAHGLNGQYIFILPEHDMIIVRLGQHEPKERKKGQPVDKYAYIRMAMDMVGLE